MRRHKDDYETDLDILESLIRDAWMLSLQTAPESVIPVVNEDLLARAPKDKRRPGQPASRELDFAN